MYEGDSPIAERRAAALTLDQGLLAELLGRAELRELLDAEVLAEVEAELQRPRAGPARPRHRGARRRAPAGGAADAPPSWPSAATAAVEEPLDLLARARRVVEVRVAGEARWAVVEDVGRLRDALGVPVPPGTPEAFTEPAEDPLGDLVGRLRPHPRPVHAPPTSPPGSVSGVAVVHQTLVRLAAQGRVLEGEFRPGGTGTEWCDAEVLRKLRRRSLARLRHEVEPVEPAALGRFLPAWQAVVPPGDGAGAARRRRRGRSGRAARRLRRARLGPGVAGAAEPGGRLPAGVPRRADRRRRGALGRARRPARADGWVSLHLADSAPLTLPAPRASSSARPTRSARGPPRRRGAFFFRQLGPSSSRSPTRRLWPRRCGTWSGRAGSATTPLAPLRALARRGHGPATVPPAHRPERGSPRPGRGEVVEARRAVATALAGRWFLLPEVEPDPTRRAHAAAEALLDRHGVVTRGAVTAEHTPGGFAAAYRVLSPASRRPGAAGAATSSTASAPPSSARPARSTGCARSSATTTGRQARGASTLAATDPANPYGAALPWPARPGRCPRPPARSQGRRPGRAGGGSAGALRRARRPHAAHLHRRRGRSPASPSRRSARPCAGAPWVG